LRLASFLHRSDRMKRPAMWLILICAACGSEAVDPDEDLDGKADADGVVEHGSFDIGRTQTATMGDGATRHDWQFTLVGDAEVKLYTHPLRLDTVLYLYKRSERGWGRYIAKNDDYGGDPAAHLERELGAGEYLVRVKAGDEDVQGEFRLLSSCHGPGCAPEPLDHIQAADCVGQALDCALAEVGGALDLAEARARLEGCLAGKTGSSNGAACEGACAYPGAEPFCAATADALSFYSGQSAACRSVFTECLPDCYYSDGNIDIYPDLESTAEAMCLEYGAPSDCDRFARSRTDCGGDGAKDDCVDRCLATDGPWLGYDADDAGLAEARQFCEEGCAE
jgi:hypothetical protein